MTSTNTLVRPSYEEVTAVGTMLNKNPTRRMTTTQAAQAVVDDLIHSDLSRIDLRTETSAYTADLLWAREEAQAVLETL